MKKPVPSCTRLQASPWTLTTDSATSSAVASVMPVEVGGGPASGAGRMPSNTLGNGSSPTSRRRACIVSGGCGKYSWTCRATSELRACSAVQPGMSPRVGSSSHRPISTPMMPATAPAVRSVVCRPPSGSATWSFEPSTSPAAWPISAVPARAEMATSARVRSLASLSRLRIVGSSIDPTTTPRARPIHELTRAMNPRR